MALIWSHTLFANVRGVYLLKGGKRTCKKLIAPCACELCLFRRYPVWHVNVKDLRALEESLEVLVKVDRLFEDSVVRFGLSLFFFALGALYL